MGWLLPESLENCKSIKQGNIHSDNMFIFVMAKLSYFSNES